MKYTIMIETSDGCKVKWERSNKKEAILQLKEIVNKITPPLGGYSVCIIKQQGNPKPIFNKVFYNWERP